MFNSNSIESVMIKKYSKVGILAFFISYSTMIIGLSTLFVLILIGNLHFFEGSVGTFFGVIFLISFFSVPLGVASLCEKDRKKTFGLLSFVWQIILMIAILISV